MAASKDSKCSLLSAFDAPRVVGLDIVHDTSRRRHIAAQPVSGDPNNELHLALEDERRWAECSNYLVSMAFSFLLTQRLILVPTTRAIELQSYVDFYRHVVSDARVTSMAWGDKSPPPISLDACLSILRKKNERTWEVRGFGDFAAAEVPDRLKSRVPQTAGGWVELQEVPENIDLGALKWVGYGCIRDSSAELSRIRDQYIEEHGALPEDALQGSLPAWQEMIEIKYGFTPSEWGKGLASEIVESLHAWGIEKWGVRRFIGCTIKGNAGSRRVLQKAGYTKNLMRLWVAYSSDIADEWVYIPV